MGTDPPDHTLEFVLDAGSGIHGGGTQTGQHGMPVDEHHHRQVAIFVVIPMKEPILLVTVQLEVRGINVQNDLLRGFLVSLDQQLH